MRYAAERNITIVPEIDVPGHSAAAIVSYPELKLSARPLPEIPVSFNDGAAFDPTSERTYQFIGDVMTELASLFPGGIIHIGGDEVRYKKYWEGVPHIEAFMKKKGIRTFPDLQIMFTNRISGMLAKKGVRTIGWNEILGSDVHNDGGTEPLWAGWTRRRSSISGTGPTRSPPRLSRTATRWSIPLPA